MARLLIVLFITGIVQIFGESLPKPKPKAKVPDVSQNELQSLINAMWKDGSAKYPIQPKDVELGEKAQNNKKPLPKLFQIHESTSFNKSTELLKNVFKEFDKPIESEHREKFFDEFLKEIINSPPMKIVQRYLKKYNYEPAKNDTAFFEALKSIWLTPCGQQGNLAATAFSRVFLGQLNYKAKTVMGMHNWLRYFYQQKVKGQQLKYFGNYDHDTHFLSIKYMNGAHMNNKTTFFYGTSPEFDMALYTLCYLTRPGKEACKFQLPIGQKNVKMSVSTLEKSLAKSNTCLATAFPCIQDKACM